MRLASRGRGVVLLAVICTSLSACQPERRELSLGQPVTAPAGPSDTRAKLFEDNFYQVSQGGRLFTWYGCGGCHDAAATGYRNLGDTLWRYGGAPDQVYASIAKGRAGGMPAYEQRIPQLVLWQITAYVRQLPKTKVDQRRRQDLDEQGEPQGDQWRGPL